MKVLLFLSTKISLQQQNIASKWAIAIMSLELFNKAIYLLKHITRKFAFWIEIESLVTWLYTAKSCPALPTTGRNFNPSFSRAMATESIMVYGDRDGHLQEEKAWRKILFYWCLLSLSKETFMLKAETLLSIVSYKFTGNWCAHSIYISKKPLYHHI